jgi:hydroxypyruvate reductase/glycerate 2-kinase
MLREHARTIWQSAVDAADPRQLVREALKDPERPLHQALAGARRILVAGAGKAGAAMCLGVEEALEGSALDTLEGIVNVPDFSEPPALKRLTLHPARPAGSNQPTARGVEGAEKILAVFAGAGPEDVGLCLISGGGSALLPASVEGVSLEDKQQVTRLLHACGATINEMNAVRKHLSRVKGGRLAQAFLGEGRSEGGRALFSLLISDVIGDPLDVIASGPTAPDPTTFQTALDVLEKYQLLGQVPAAVRDHLERGTRGDVPETPKTLSGKVHNLILGNNARSLRVAQQSAEKLGYHVLNLGSFIEGETRYSAVTLAGLVRSILIDGVPVAPPVCVLSGGETTVTLGEGHGRGGRNQEFVLGAGLYLRQHTATHDTDRWLVLSGGTDGEDGPTDAAGALADADTFRRAAVHGLNPQAALDRHDAYPFFQATGDLLQTGLTNTNVMDVRVFLIG